MADFPIFVSVVLTTRNQSSELSTILSQLTSAVAPHVSDYEIVVVDNASSDESIHTLKQLTDPNGLPNIQVYALTKEVDEDTAHWVGVENALGDFVVVFDPDEDAISYLPEMLSHAMRGADLVFARNQKRGKTSIPYRLAHTAFNLLYRWWGGVHLGKEAPQFRVLSRRVIHFVLQHPQPALAYRYLPAASGFAKAHLTYAQTPTAVQKKRLGDSFDRGMRLLFSTTHAPMRLVTSLSLFGAGANLIYSFYVVAIGFFKHDVAPGWTSLSLQQSGMFFLISLVLLVLGEYLLNMVRLANEGPLYHVAQEFTSAQILRRKRLNLEESTASVSLGSVS